MRSSSDRSSTPRQSTRHSRGRGPPRPCGWHPLCGCAPRRDARSHPRGHPAQPRRSPDSDIRDNVIIRPVIGDSKFYAHSYRFLYPSGRRPPPEGGGSCQTFCKNLLRSIPRRICRSRQLPRQMPASGYKQQSRAFHIEAVSSGSVPLRRDSSGLP